MYVSFFVLVEHGVDDDGDACLKLTDVVRLKPVLVWKGQPGGKIENHLKRDGWNNAWNTIMCLQQWPKSGKPILKPEAKPARKPTPKGKHVKLFKMRRKVGKGFYSIALDAPNGQ